MALTHGGDEPPAGMRAVSATLRRWLLGPLRYTADLVLPPICLNCHEPLCQHCALCACCWQKVDFIRDPLCDRLGLPLPYTAGEVTLSSAALRRTPDYDRARAVARFDGVMRDLVHRLKYSDHHELLDLFAPMLRGAGTELLADAQLLIPVPLHRWRLWTRRFNQAALLARRLGRDSGVPVELVALQRIKRTASQVSMSREARRRNVGGAFAVVPARANRVRGSNIVLIDDVITTGATVEACARVLKEAGAARVDVLALALVADDEAFHD